MAAPKRTAFQRERDLERIAELYLQGRTQSEIAGTLADERDYEITQQIISRDLQTIQGRWQEAAEASIDAYKARELAKIDTLERTYWQAWDRSCKARTVTSGVESSGEKTSDRNGEETSSSMKKAARSEERDGNPAFLAGVMECISKRCKLLGLDAPTKISTEVSGKDGGPIEVDSPRERLASSLASIAARVGKSGDTGGTE
jgi:hypothetical protein